MARKRTAAHREAHDNTTERDRAPRKDPALETHEKRVRHTEAILRRAAEEHVEEDSPHYGVRPDDLSEQLRPMSPEDPAAEMPASIEKERERWPEMRQRGGDVPEGDHPFQPMPVDKKLAERPPWPEYRHGDPNELLGDYTVLARGGDIAAAGLEDVDPASIYPIDPDAPKAGEEGGAPLGEPTEMKHNPGAPWPGPNESFAAAPTASPAPGPEPDVQYNPPQDIVWEDKPEAARGVAVDQTPPEPPVEPARRREQRYTTREPEEDKRKKDDTPRDEAGQVSIDHMAEKALESVIGLYKGADEEPVPFRLQKALELAARRIMSPAYWDIRERFFVSRETEPAPGAA